MGEQKFVHMTNMAAMPICGKTFKSLILWNKKADDVESWYAAFGIQVLKNMIKQWPGVDLDLFPYIFVWGKR